MPKYTKEQYLSKYERAVRQGCVSKRKPTWQHWPAGNLYWGRYVKDGKPGPVAAARLFLAETVWGREPAPRRKA